MNIVEKLWDTIINNGLGALFKPWQIKRVALAEAISKRKQMLIEAQTEMDIIKIKSGAVTIDDKGEKTLSNDLIDALLMDENLQVIKRKMNLLNAVDKTFTLLESDTEKCDERSEKPSDEWFDRWREYSEKANTEEVQNLWARILNQEIRYGGSVSLRTLDFIRSVSTNEAKLIEKVFSFSIENLLVYNITNDTSDLTDDKKSLLPKMGVTKHALSELQYLGIIEGVNSFGVISDIPSSFTDKYYQKIEIGDKNITISNMDKNSKVFFLSYQFTILGLELIKILQLKKDIAYFIQLFNNLRAKGFEVIIE